MNCLTWDGTRVTNWASSAPALALLKWCATGLELMEQRYWQRGPPSACGLAVAAWRYVSAAGHALLPALGTGAEQMEQEDQAPRAALAAPATSVISVWEDQIESTSVMAVNISCAVTICESITIVKWPSFPSLLLSQVLPKAVPCYHPHLTAEDPVMCHHRTAGWTWIPSVQSWN